MQTLKDELRNCVSGDLHFDEISRIAYSVDASIYEIEPLGIVIPRTTQDLVNAVKIAAAQEVPVIARGAATGITGGCLGKGLIIDTSKYLNQIHEINFEEEYAVCEPGVVQDQLNLALAKQGYRLGPDTSTGNRATLGGMLANNAAGARSLRYGQMSDHILQVEMVLANGEILEFSPVSEAALQAKLAQNNQEGHLYKEIIRIRDQYQDEIEKNFPKIPRRVSGYNLNSLIKPGPLNVCSLIAGSEGTFGIAVKIKVKICKKPKASALCILNFSTLADGMEAIPEMLKFNPTSLELIDHQIISLGLSAPSLRGKLDWIQGLPACIFTAEFDGESDGQAMDKAVEFQKAMQSMHVGYNLQIIQDPLQITAVWDLRKSGLGLLLSRKTYSRAIAFIEDLSVSPEKLSHFMDKFNQYLKANQREAGIYGHAGSGCIHFRPFINLRDKNDVAIMSKMMHDISDLILEHGGAMSGEHGDGLVRSWLNRKMFGDKLYTAFKELKTAFDPGNLMNPGKIVDGPPLLSDLRVAPETPLISIPTFLDFSAEGGFHLAVDLCNGNGLCRKAETLMCPSFQATKDEYDTTRARAQALRAVVNGKLPFEKFTSREIYDVLDLCLECKGCKTECPSQVDMAKIKSEFLYHYQEKHGYSLRNQLFANIGKIQHVFSFFPGVFNALNKTGLSKQFLSWMGVAPQRSLPPLAQERFSSWFKTYIQPPEAENLVILFNDTFTEFNQPQIGKAAVNILSSLGYKSVVFPWQCCGRPMISKGMLQQAKKQAAALVQTLYPLASEGVAIIGLEPSCLLTLKDDMTSFFPKSDPLSHQIAAIADSCITFDEFIAKHLIEGTFPFYLNKNPAIVKLHGHCHHKSLIGTAFTLAVLKAIPGFEVSEIPSGCCGMAGSFGYEKEHYDLSIKIGELKLMPAIRETSKNAILAADGFSCRNQILHSTGRSAKHLAEIVNDAINFDPNATIQ